MDDHPGAEVIGVVKDSKYKRVAKEVAPTVYYPLAQRGMTGQITVEIRAAVGATPMALLPQIQRVMRDIDPDMPLQKPMTQEAQFEESYLTPRLFSQLAVGFGLLATFLVATGIYGTLANRMQRRRKEIGVRMALGANRTSIAVMVLRESSWLILGGLVLGLPLCYGLSRLMRAQLYHLDVLDPASFLAGTAVICLVVFAASLLPARKAAAVDPMAVLRSE